ncbi:MAG: leuB [Gammaproteobacteria bacterium]|jgi:3-isopropylmalate dehydrogenase|nr:leuB [Gammaproteobacteria bacterium]
MHKTIAVLSGDGIGPEVMEQTLRVLDAVAKKYQHNFTYLEAKIGGAAYDTYSEHCPDETLEICKKSDAILFGSVGGPITEQHQPKWAGCEANSILKLRKHFQFNINVRPVLIYPSLAALSPLRAEKISHGIDILIFRELNGDLYFGRHEQRVEKGQRVATDEAIYDESQIASIAHAAFQSAEQRKGKLVSVDKANVLATSKLWREVVNEVGKKYPDVELTHILVDNCAMQLIIHPAQFDVILAPNMFGDILSDLAAALPGSLGLIPSISLNAQGFGLYEPSGGSAPDIAGMNIANPIAQILSATMMLRHSFNLHNEADAIEHAIQQALAAGGRTKDIASSGEVAVSTCGFVDKILDVMR